jgi:hypothetical protein
MVKEIARINLIMDTQYSMELVCGYCLDIINSPNYFCHECTYKRITSPIQISELPFKLKDRIQNKKYMFNGKVVICKGGVLNCIHGIRRTRCSDIQCIEPSNNCIHELPKKNCPECKVVTT